MRNFSIGSEALRKALVLSTFVWFSVAVSGFAQKAPPPVPSGFLPVPSICEGVAGNLVANCGFETGTFSGWTTIPAASGSDFGVFASDPHSGTYAGWFGAVGAFDDCITQTLSTAPGSTYKLDFWLTHLDTCPGCADFHVFWNGADLMDFSSSSFPYTEIACSQVAAGRDVLKFCGREVPSWFVLDDVSVVLSSGGAAACAVAAAGCPHHTVHGHLVLTPPNGHNGDVSGLHHGQHGHTVSSAECLPPGHDITVAGHILGLTPESADGAIPNALTPEPDFVAALNQDGLNAPAAPGTIVQLFGSAKGLFLDLADLRPALEFTPSVSGSPLYYTEALPEVQIGGVKAEVLFSGLAPGLKGVWQINVRVPEGAGSGKVPVTIAYDGEAVTSVDLAVE